jgi:hypothetical protein
LKRSKEVTIIVDSLVQSGLLEERNTDRASCVIKNAIKEIRIERYKERRER